MFARFSRILLIFTLALSGCVQTHLRKTTVHQASTISDIHAAQVLNNLAMFTCDPHALPHFLVPNASATSVTGAGSADLRANWLTIGTESLGASFVGSRTVNGNFTLVPINDPKKLALMRCAYQTAIFNCGCGSVSNDCPECEARFIEFYGDRKDSENQRCLDQKSCCWFKCGGKHDVPKNTPRKYVGRHGDRYVWIPPNGRDELTKLTLAILEYAVYESPQEKTRQVVRIVQKDPTGNVTGITEQTTFSEPIKGQYRARQLSPAALPGNVLGLRQSLEAVSQ